MLLQPLLSDFTGLVFDALYQLMIAHRTTCCYNTGSQPFHSMEPNPDLPFC